MFNTSNRPGQQPFENKKIRAVNRCGTTALVLGQVVCFDLDASDAATQALSGVGGITLPSLVEAVWHNVVQPGAAPINAVCGVVTSLLSGAGADNTQVEVQIWGACKAKVGGTNWSSALSSCGVALMVSTTAADRQLILATDGANTGKVALITENIATDLSSSSQALTNIVLFGIGSSLGSVGA